MVSTHRYVSNVERRFYAPYWLSFCDHLKLAPQTYGAFAKTGHMIGLKLPRDIYTDDKVVDMVRSLRMFYEETQDGILIRCFLFGSRYYKFVFFEDAIAISEDDDENVRRRTSQSQ